MCVLESTPNRYDRGIRLLIRGGVEASDSAIYRRSNRTSARLLKSSSATITTT